MKINEFSKNTALKLFFIISLFLTLVQLSVCYINELNGLGYPYNTYLFRPDARFSDLVNLLNQSKEFQTVYVTNHGENLPANYLPAVYILYGLIQKNIPSDLRIISTICVGISLTILAAFLFAKKMNVNLLLVLAIIFTSYPVIFTYDRLNSEILILPLMLCFLTLFPKFRSILPLICMATLKITPLIYALCYLRASKSKYLIYSVCIFSLVTLVSYLPMNGSFIEIILNNFKSIKYFTRIYSENPDGHIFSSSLSNIFYYLGLVYKNFMIPKILLLIATVILVAHSYNNERLSIPRLFVTLSIVSILIPDASFDYKLTSLVAVILYAILNDAGLRNLIFITLCALAIAPISYFHFGLNNEANISLLIRPVILIVLLVYTLLKKDSFNACKS